MKWFRNRKKPMKKQEQAKPLPQNPSVFAHKEELCAIFGAEPMPDRAADVREVLDALCEQEYLAYIDWKMEYADVLWNANQLLGKLEQAELDLPDKEDLLGERAVEDVLSQVKSHEYCGISIDDGSDGLLMGFVLRKRTDRLRAILEEQASDVILKIFP